MHRYKGLNILFLTVVRIDDVEERGIYTDLLREFRANGHNVFVAYPSERRYKEKTGVRVSNGITLLNIHSLNVQKTNLFEKGIATLSFEKLFFRALRKYFPSLEVDLVLYSTPPITFTNVVEYYKKKCGAITYLLLKDIFPQNAVDLKMLHTKGLLYRYFRAKEKKLYSISDYIGCMSPANVAFVRKHNAFLHDDKVEICPNAVKPINSFISNEQKKEIRKQYAIPENAIICMYGGNIGRPQGVEFIMEILAAQQFNERVFFIIAGNGTDFDKMADWFKKHNPVNALLIPQLEKNTYDKLLQSCDIGLIFLNPEFTIPNFPSRMLSYMEYSMPVLLAVDRATDIGHIAEEGQFGLSSLSGDLAQFNQNLDLLICHEDKRITMGKNARRYLENTYRVENCYQTIMNHL